jgi:hypothetical protein
MTTTSDNDEKEGGSEARAQEGCGTMRAVEKVGARRAGLTRDQALVNLMATFERIWREFWEQHSPPGQP